MAGFRGVQTSPLYAEAKNTRLVHIYKVGRKASDNGYPEGGFLAPPGLPGRAVTSGIPGGIVSFRWS